MRVFRERERAVLAIKAIKYEKNTPSDRIISFDDRVYQPSQQTLRTANEKCVIAVIFHRSTAAICSQSLSAYCTLCAALFILPFLVYKLLFWLYSSIAYLFRLALCACCCCCFLHFGGCSNWVPFVLFIWIFFLWNTISIIFVCEHGLLLLHFTPFVSFLAQSGARVNSDSNR